MSTGTVTTMGAKPKKAVWLSFDLSVNGDYVGLFRWLDKHGAKECGDSVAFLELPWTNDVLFTLRKSLARSVKLKPRDRVYAVYREGDLVRGRWLSGGRLRAPWEGAAGGTDDEDDGGTGAPRIKKGRRR